MFMVLEYRDFIFLCTFTKKSGHRKKTVVTLKKNQMHSQDERLDRFCREKHFNENNI